MFLNGVGVVFSGTLEDYVGMSIAWFTKVARDHVVLSLPARAQGTNRVVSERRFTLSLLSESQAEVARQFGGTGQASASSLDRPVLLETDGGTPAIYESCAVYLCDVVSAETLGDQVLVTARLIGPAYATAASPLVYREADYF